MPKVPGLSDSDSARINAWKKSKEGKQRMALDQGKDAAEQAENMAQDNRNLQAAQTQLKNNRGYGGRG